MADDGAQNKNLSGWGHEIVTVYDSFLFRDLLGYVFPGAVLLLGVDGLLFYEPSILGSIKGLGLTDWLTAASGLSVAYLAGVFLRIFGSMTHILVIAPVVGWLGDPWDLKKGETRNCVSLWERVWKSPYENAVTENYKSIYLERSGNLAKVSDREAVFLHLTGNLGLALLVVGLISLVEIVTHWEVWVPTQIKATALFLLVGSVLTAEHYRHARAILLLHKASK